MREASYLKDIAEVYRFLERLETSLRKAMLALLDDKNKINHYYISLNRKILGFPRLIQYSASISVLYWFMLNLVIWKLTF